VVEATQEELKARVKERRAEQTVSKRVAAIEVIQQASKVKLVGIIAVVGGIITFAGASIHPLVPTVSAVGLILAGGFFFATSKQTIEHLTEKYLV